MLLCTLPQLNLNTLSLHSFCCVYLAFKIDEYVVSVDQFGNTLTPDLRQEVVEYVLSHEVLSAPVLSRVSLNDSHISLDAAVALETTKVSSDSPHPIQTYGGIPN